MKVGISTASLFVRYKTEDALSLLAKNNIPCAEVFLESFCEYNKDFGKLLNSVKGNTKVHSIHTLTTQFEPQLFSINERAVEDSFGWLKNTMESAKEFGAEYYTFHGPARIKRTPYLIDYDKVARQTQKVIDAIKPYGVTLAYENVHWCYYNYVGYYSELKKRTDGLKATLDIKQARQSDISVYDLIDEMANDIVTVHISDVDADGKMCLPGKGMTDFIQLFNKLNDAEFNGAILLEVYQNDYKQESELFESYHYIKDKAEKIFCP